MTRVELPCGIRLIVTANRFSPSVSVRFCLQTGSVHDPSGRDGLALLTGILLEEGTRRRKGKEIAEMIDFLGAETDVAVDKHATLLLASLMKKDLEVVMRLLAEMVTLPLFPAAALSRVKAQLLTGIREEEHDTRALALRMLAGLLYPKGHAYRRPGGGTRRSVRAIGRGEIVRFHREMYHPRGAILVVVGDVDEEKTVRLISRIFRGWRKEGDAGPPDVPSVVPPTRPAIKSRIVAEKTQCDVVYGFIGVKRSDPDFYDVAVMNQILGAFGMGGRLGNRIREKEGLAYYVSSSVHASVGRGPILIRAGVHPDHVVRAIRIIGEEVDRIRHDLVTPQELRETKNFMIDSIPLRLETNEGIASFLLREEYYRLGPDFLSRYRETVRGVTRKDVREAARRLLLNETFSVAVAGPRLPVPLEEAIPLPAESGK